MQNKYFHYILIIILILLLTIPIQTHFQYTSILNKTEQYTLDYQLVGSRSGAFSVDNPDTSWRDIRIYIPEGENNVQLGKFPISIASTNIKFGDIPPFSLKDQQGVDYGTVLEAEIRVQLYLHHLLENQYELITMINETIVLDPLNTSTVHSEEFNWIFEKPGETFNVVSHKLSSSYLITFNIVRITQYDNRTISTNFATGDYLNPDVLSNPSFTVIWGNSYAFIFQYIGFILIALIIYISYKKYYT